MKRALLILLFAASAHAELSHRLDRWVPERFPNARKVPITVTNFMPEIFLGYYNPNEKHIYIRVGTDDHVLAHEVGHAIWWGDLTMVRRFHWCWFVRFHPDLIAAQVYPDDCAHSFAEAFGEYVTGPRLMQANEPEFTNGSMN